MDDLVILNEKEIPTTTSLLIAEKFEKPHNDVLKVIRKTAKECQTEGISLGKISQRNYKNRGREYTFYEVDRDAFTFIVMGFSGKKALRFKSDYIKLFNRMEHKLRQIELERQSTEWNLARIDGKMQRRKLTDILAPFQIYAINQGSDNTAIHAYSNFSRIVNKAAGVKGKERDILTDDMLRRVAHLEGIVEMKIKELMSSGVYCKEIYQQCKDVLGNFVELVPHTGEVYLPKSEQMRLVA